MNANIKEAVRVLAAYTADRFDLWALAGGARASCRAHVMSVLLGRKVPQSKSGVFAMREAFYAVPEFASAGDSDECAAGQDARFRAKCRAIMAAA